MPRFLINGPETPPPNLNSFYFFTVGLGANHQIYLKTTNKSGYTVFITLGQLVHSQATPRFCLAVVEKWLHNKNWWKWASFQFSLHSLHKFILPTRPYKVIVSCPAPLRTCEEEGLVFWTTFLVTLYRVAPRSESSNQILERIIICMT